MNISFGPPKIFLMLKVFYRNLLPLSLRLYLRLILKKIIYFYRYIKLLISSRLRFKLNLILGAALTSQYGWISTNEQYFDITNSSDWYRCLGKHPNLNRLVAEHVLEHLTFEEMRSCLKLSHNYLNFNGSFLIAVPDGNHPDSDYRRNVGINGLGPDAVDHQQFLTWEVIESVSSQIGFSAALLEGFKKDGTLISCYHPSLGFGRIMRSRCHGINNSFFPKSKEFDFCDSKTSLIVILRKNLHND